MKVHKRTVCLTSSLNGEKFSTFSLDEKSTSIYWIGSWVAPKASLGAEEKKNSLFLGTAQRAPGCSDHNINIIIIQL
jgi:hypothetical protein